jgi:hypothetical protein
VSLEGPVIDHVGLFSPGAVERATKRIAELRQDHGWDLVVETLEEQVDSRHLSGVFNTFERQRFIDGWARERADATLGRKKGLFVLFTRQPEDVRIVAWPDEADVVFPGYMRERMRTDLKPQMRQNPDGALDLAVAQWEGLLGRVKVRSNPLETVPLLLVLAFLSALCLVLVIARRQMYGRGERPPLYPPAVQCGVFGTPACLWISDRQLDLERPQAPPANTPEQASS